jgi:hypothetical protein
MLFIGKKHLLSKKKISKFLEWNQYFPLYISYMRKVKLNICFTFEFFQDILLINIKFTVRISLST